MSADIMNLLSNTKIATKIASIVTMLCAMALGSMVYLVFMAKGVDADYSKVLDQDAEAGFALLKANREITELGYHAYKAVAYPGASPEAKNSADSYRKSIANIKESLGKARELLPNASAKLAKINEQVAEIDKLLAPAVEAGLKDQNDQARGLLVKADPLVAQAVADGAALRISISEGMRQSSVSLTAHINASAMWILGAGFIVTLLMFAGALLVSAKGITGPLGRLQGRMRELADGKLVGLIGLVLIQKRFAA